MKKYEYNDENEDEFLPTKRFLEDWHKQDPRQQNPFLYEPHRADIRRIKGVLTNFRSLWAEKIVPPDWMMDFMADGAGKFCANGVPWPTNAKRSLCPRVVGMVQVIYERFGMSDGVSDQKLRSEIAAELDLLPRTVGNYLTITGNHVEYYVDFFRWVYPAQDTPDMRKAERYEMLSTLSELTKYHYDHDELDLMKLWVPFTPLPNDLVERIPRFRDARRRMRRKEEDRNTIQLLNQVNDLQEQLLEHMREILREETQELLDFKPRSTELPDLLSRWEDLLNRWQGLQDRWHDLEGLWLELENRWQEPENRWQYLLNRRQLIVNQWRGLNDQLLGVTKSGHSEPVNNSV